MDYKGAMWRHHHHRFGLAGERQADAIQRFLDARPGRLLNIGCGINPAQIQRIAHFAAWQCAADDSKFLATVKAQDAGASMNTSWLVADANRLPLVSKAFDHITAFGLFAMIADVAGCLRELGRVCRDGGHVYLTNAVRHPKEPYLSAAAEAGLVVVETMEGYCPDASGGEKRRYLLIFQKTSGRP